MNRGKIWKEHGKILFSGQSIGCQKLSAAWEAAYGVLWVPYIPLPLVFDRLGVGERSTEMKNITFRLKNSDSKDVFAKKNP